jgi:hypothetical protein
MWRFMTMTLFFSALGCTPPSASKVAPEETTSETPTPPIPNVEAPEETEEPEEPAPPLGPYGSREFTLEATEHWLNTGLYVRPGMTVRISAIGTWSMQTGYSSGPEGLDYEVAGCNWGALVARVGLPYYGETRCIGSEKTLDIASEGILFVGSNDYGREDNAGSLVVSISSEGEQSPVVKADELVDYPLETISAGMIELSSEHVLLTLPKSLVARYQSSAPQALDQFDSWYNLHASLAGAAPYGGRRIRYFPDPTVYQLGAWMIAGNPIRVDPASLDGFPGNSSILQVHDPLYSVWGFVHEMGHDFTYINGRSYLIGYGPTEAWANIFTLHTLGAQNHPEAERPYCGGVAAYLTSGSYAQFLQDPWLPLCMLMEFKAKYGWSFYQRFFRWHGALDLEAAQVPLTTDPDAVRWAWLRDSFNALAGEDTSPVFLKYKVPLE